MNSPDHALDPDGELDAAIGDEFEWGRSFLQKEGYPGAELIVTPPDGLGARFFELGARFDSMPDRTSSAVVHVDPARVGWRLESWLSICLDSYESCDEEQIGASRLAKVDEIAARVLVRGVVVALRDYLKGDYRAHLSSDIQRR